MKFKPPAALLEFIVLNKRLVGAVGVALAGLLAMQTLIGGGASRECLGVTDSKETNIAFETPVLVKRVFVLPGQTVKKGQPLLEVEPAETNLKVMEVQTQLQSLEGEREVRNALIGSFGKKGNGSTALDREIEGMRKQLDELKRQQGLSVRYAEEDGNVATVAFRAREQVPPFIPVITLTSASPNLVYGFIHESRLSDFKLGDNVVITGNSGRSASGKVVSLGSRITPFPERFQIGPSQRPTYFGRELVVSLPPKNSLLVGEKVSIRTERNSPLIEFGFHAYANAGNAPTDSQKVAANLPFEAGGMVFLTERNSLLVVSDDQDKGGSPFWIVPLDRPMEPLNIVVEGVGRVDDLESLTRADGHFYSMSSLSKDKKDRVKEERNLILRFAVSEKGIQINRALDLRTPLLEAVRNSPLLRSVAADLEELEVEAMTFYAGDAYLALKQPRMPDGSSAVLRLPGLAGRIEAQNLASLEVEVFALLNLETRECQDPARITDMIKTEDGFHILSNCKKSEKTGQLWFLANGVPAQQVQHVTSFRNGRPEGLAIGATRGEIFVSSDNGGNLGSDILKMNTSEAR